MTNINRIMKLSMKYTNGLSLRWGYMDLAMDGTDFPI
jgi:hypothetical protein